MCAEVRRAIHRDWGQRPSCSGKVQGHTHHHCEAVPRSSWRGSLKYRGFTGCGKTRVFSFGRTENEAGAKCRVSRGCLHLARRLVRSRLWKRWKAEGRFPLSHNRDGCYGHESSDVLDPLGLKPQFVGVAFLGTAEAVPFQSSTWKCKQRLETSQLKPRSFVCGYRRD